MIEVNTMKKELDFMVRVILLTAFAVALCLGASCKKSTEPEVAPTPEQTEAQPAVPQEQAEQAAPTEKEPATAMEAVAGAVAEKVEEAAATVKEAAQAATANLVPVDIELPKPMFVGTPQDTKVDNLEKPLGKPRPPFLAPEGTANVARDKPISGSDEEPIIGDIEMITDGDKEAADGSYVELGPFAQYITIDLEQQCELYAIVAWHYHKQPRVYFDVVVQVSNDPDFIADVTTVFNNDIDNSAGLGIGTDMHYTETNEGKLIDLLSKGSPKARYVRLYSNGNTSNDLNHYIEVDVYGKPVE